MLCFLFAFLLLCLSLFSFLFYHIMVNEDEYIYNPKVVGCLTATALIAIRRRALWRCVGARDMRDRDAARCWRPRHGETQPPLLLMLLLMMFGCQGMSTTNDAYRRAAATQAGGKLESLHLRSSSNLLHSVCSCPPLYPFRERTVQN